jgi:hypothetical protein
MLNNLAVRAKMFHTLICTLARSRSEPTVRSLENTLPLPEPQIRPEPSIALTSYEYRPNISIQKFRFR